MLVLYIVFAVVLLSAIVGVVWYQQKKATPTMFALLYLQKTYNKRLTLLFGKGATNIDPYCVSFLHQESLDAHDILHNVRLLQAVAQNARVLYRLKKVPVAERVSQLKTQLLPVGQIKTGMQANQKLADPLYGAFYHIRSVFRDVFDPQNMPPELAPYFGHVPVYAVGKYWFLFLQQGVVMIPQEDLLQCKFVPSSEFIIQVTWVGNEEVEYDGSYPLEDVDFYQTRQTNTLTTSGIDVITKVRGKRFQLELGCETVLEAISQLVINQAHIQQLEGYIKEQESEK